MGEQIDIFEALFDHFVATKKVRLIELFAGYGSQSLAMKYLGVDFERYLAVDFDKWAVQSYNEIHGTDFPVTDITKLESLGMTETDKYSYWVFYSFPCTDISNAGLMKGYDEGSGTRSSLLWEVKRLLLESKEKAEVLVMENVPGVLSDKDNWKKWTDFLESLGYQNYTKVLNAKDYGIPQNRRRAFCVSVLGDRHFNFPKPMKLEYRLKDFLERNVGEEYYLSEKAVSFFTYNSEKQKENGNGFRFEPRERERAELGKAITTRAGGRMDDNFIAERERCEMVGTLNKYGCEMTDRVYSADHLSPTIRARNGDDANGIKIDDNESETMER